MKFQNSVIIPRLDLLLQNPLPPPLASMPLVEL